MQSAILVYVHQVLFKIKLVVKYILNIKLFFFLKLKNRITQVFEHVMFLQNITLF